jgi:hypothetical protein
LEQELTKLVLGRQQLCPPKLVVPQDSSPVLLPVKQNALLLFGHKAPAAAFYSLEHLNLYQMKLHQILVGLYPKELY